MRNSYPTEKINTSLKPLRAYVEIIGGELAIYPIADSAEEQTILDAIRLIVAEGGLFRALSDEFERRGSVAA